MHCQRCGHEHDGYQGMVVCDECTVRFSIPRCVVYLPHESAKFVLSPCGHSRWHVEYP
jgi:hypothetical protein